jgi:hypothetical protein
MIVIVAKSVKIVLTKSVKAVRVISHMEGVINDCNKKSE